MQRLYVCLPPCDHYVTVETRHALSLQFGKVRISMKSRFYVVMLKAVDKASELSLTDKFSILCYNFYYNLN